VSALMQCSENGLSSGKSSDKPLRPPGMLPEVTGSCSVELQQRYASEVTERSAAIAVYRAAQSVCSQACGICAAHLLGCQAHCG